MTTINGDISDLFFNRDFEHCRINNAQGNFVDWDGGKLHTEAEEFLASLGRLGVDVPRVADLIANFKNRI